MKNATRLAGLIAAGVVSAAALGGCASNPDGGPATINNGSTAGTGGATAGAAGTFATAGTAGTGTAGTAGAGGTAGAAGTGGTAGAAGGTHLKGTAAYTILTAEAAAPGATPAPAAYADAGCATCHGAAAQGTKLLAPEIRHTPVEYSNWVVRHGRIADGMPTGMVAFPETSADPKVSAITAADLTAVQTWLQGLPRPTQPQQLYQDFCGNCHGPTTPTGGAATVSILGKTIADVDMKVRMGEGTDPTMRDGFMPKFSLTELTDAELTAIKTFIQAK